jgi:hypothetical protein
MNEDEIGYALSKQVPAMRDEVRLCTRYGDLVLYDREAAQVAVVVERMLRMRWQGLQRAGGEQG